MDQRRIVVLIGIISFAVLGSVTNISLAQRGHLSGVVRAAAFGDPLPGVNVVLQDTPWGAATSVDGVFHIAGLPAGTYHLIASSLGFLSTHDTVSIAAGDTTFINIELSEHPVEISEIVIERVMMTGGRSGVLDIPGAAHYVNARELEKFSYNDIHRILRQVPGVNIQEEDGYGLRPNIGMRGTGVERSSKITIMEDGVLMAPAPYAAPAAYYFPTVGRMQGVEVRKGSSQIKYGPHTTGGALNLISTQIPDRFRGYAKILAGENQDRTIHAHVGESYDRFGFLVETYQAKTQGFKHLEFGGNTGFDKKDYLAKVRFNTRPGARIYQALTVKAGQTSETSNETYLGLTEEDFARTPYLRYAGSQEDVITTDQQHYVARHVIRPSDRIDVTTTLYRTEFSRNWFKLDRVRASVEGPSVSIASVLDDPSTYSAEYAILRGETSINDDALEVKNNNRSYYAQGVQTVAGFTVPSHTALHEVEVGIRYHIDQVDRYQWVDVYRMNDTLGGPGGNMLLTRAGVPGTDSNRIVTARALAAHTQYRLSYADWTITPGLRYEHVVLDRKDYGKADPDRIGLELSERGNTVGVFIPGIGIDYAVTAALHGFVGIHKGFAPPAVREESRPEESVNYEAGFRFNDAVWLAEGTLFFSDYSNLLGADLAAAGGGGTVDQFNGGEVNAYGLELSFEARITRQASKPTAFPIYANYTFSRAQFKNTFESEFEPWGTVERGDELPYLPRHQLSLGVGVERGRAIVSVTANYMAAMRTRAGQGALVQRESTDDYVLIDISSTFNVTRNVGVFLSVRNLTDRAYIVARRPAGLRPGLPRTALVGLKATF